MKNPLQEINRSHAHSNFIERLATLDGKNNGQPHPKFLQEQPYLYVLRTSNWLSSIEKSITTLTSIKKSILNPPPGYWLENVGMTLDDFYKEKIELFVITVSSSVDGILNLINQIYLSPFRGREINPQKLKEISGDQQLNKSIDQMMNCTKEIRSKRNSLVHRLESPQITTLSEIRRIKFVINNFSMPKSSLIYNYDEGTKILIEEIDKYSNNLKLSNDDICCLMVNLYKKNIETFGGIREPNQNEIELAKSVIEYFDGGEKPLHW